VLLKIEADKIPFALTSQYDPF